MGGELRGCEYMPKGDQDTGLGAQWKEDSEGRQMVVMSEMRMPPLKSISIVVVSISRDFQLDLIPYSSAMMLSIAGMIPAIAVVVLPVAFGGLSGVGHRARDFRALTDAQVERIAKLDPPEWESTTAGHLGKLLIPRVCECAMSGEC